METRDDKSHENVKLIYFRRFKEEYVKKRDVNLKKDGWRIGQWKLKTDPRVNSLFVFKHSIGQQVMNYIFIRGKLKGI